MKCLQCEAEVQPTWKACPECGAKMPGSSVGPGGGLSNASGVMKAEGDIVGGSKYEGDFRHADGATVGGGIHINIGGAAPPHPQPEVQYEDYILAILQAGGKLENVRADLEERRRKLGLSLHQAREIERTCSHECGSSPPAKPSITTGNEVTRSPDSWSESKPRSVGIEKSKRLSNLQLMVLAIMVIAAIVGWQFYHPVSDRVPDRDKNVAHVKEAENQPERPAATRRESKMITGSSEQAVGKTPEAMRETEVERQKRLALEHEQHLDSIPQKDITEQWKTLTWFDNAGRPKVWYSETAAGGYRLWIAEGFDPDSGKRVQPVTDQATKSKVLANLAEREQVQIQRDENAKAEAENRMQEERQRQAIQERERLLVRYVVLGQLRNSKEAKRIAVLVADDTQMSNNALSQALAAVMQSKAANASGFFFTKEFISDGLFDKAFKGSPGVLDSLALSNVIDTLMLGRETMQFTTNQAMEGVVTAKIKLELTVLSAQTGLSFQSHTATAIGAGFKNADAQALAEENLMKQFTNKTSNTGMDGFFKTVLLNPQ